MDKTWPLLGTCSEIYFRKMIQSQRWNLIHGGYDSYSPHFSIVHLNLCTHQKNENENYKARQFEQISLGAALSQPF